MKFFKLIVAVIIAGGGHNISYSCTPPCVAPIKPCDINIGPCSLCPAYPKECVGRPANCEAFNWRQFTRDHANTRNAIAECTLNYKNVANLQPEWSLFFQGAASLSGNPAAVDDVLYFSAGGPFVAGTQQILMYAVDAITGVRIWTSPSLGTLATGFMSLTPAVGTRAVYSAGTVSRNLFALDKNTGSIIWGPVTVFPSLAIARINSGLVLIEEEDLLIVCTSLGSATGPGSGSVIGVRASTGAVLWQYNTSENPTPGQPNTGGAGVGIFGTPAVDTTTGLLYVGTGQNLAAPVTPIADSLLVLNYRTTNPNGEYVWHHQFTSDDVGNNNFCTSGSPSGCTAYSGAQSFYKDWDLPGGPFLLCVKNCDGTTRNVVVIGSKQGNIYGLDRDTHALLWTTVLTNPNPTGSSEGGVNSMGATDGDVVYVTSIYSIDGFPFLSTNSSSGVAKSATAVFAVRVADGKILWRKDFPGATFAALTVANGLLYFQDSNSSLPSAPTVDVGAVLRIMDVRDGSVLYTRAASGFPDTNYINFGFNPVIVFNFSFNPVLVYKGAVYQPFGLFGTLGFTKLALPS